MSTRTIFSVDGLSIGRSDRNMTYLYGLSDFWLAMFEDSAKIDLLLEATSLKLSDIYSKFLQLTSSISIQDIEIATGQQIKLVLIKESDAVQGKLNTYKLPETITQSRYIANRLLLPTAYLESGIHYEISEDGTEIAFFESIASVGFASRLVEVDGDTTREFSLWLVDSLVDEQILYRYFGKLIDVTPQTSTENFKNFIYGLYYLYTNGPNLALMRKGLNLCLGIPLARETETVLETRKYLDTDQWLVITDLNSYLIPYGLTPSVVAGDVLEATQELAQWIEVKDYLHDGDWWINLAIPSNLMPYIPAGEPDRYAKTGTYADYLMRNFLKKHTFLVNVKTIDFKNLQNFAQLSSIINEVKPKYTYPIYIWTVPTLDEVITIDDNTLTQERIQPKSEILTVPMERFKRFLPDYTGYTVAHSTINNSFGSPRKISDDGTFSTAKAVRIGLAPNSGNYYWEAYIRSYPANILTPQFRIGVGTSAASLAVPAGQESTSWGFETRSRFVSHDTGETWVVNGIAKAMQDRANYLYFPGGSGNYVSSPNSNAMDGIVDIDIVIKLSVSDFNVERVFIGRQQSASTSWYLRNGSDKTLKWVWSTDGTATTEKISTASLPFNNGDTFWARVVHDTDNGAAGNDVKFYYSYNGTDWTQLGSTVTTGSTTSIFDNDKAIELGSRDTGTAGLFVGKIYYAEVRSGIDGLGAVRFDAANGNPGETATITSNLNDVWTMNGTVTLNTELNNIYAQIPGTSGAYFSTADGASVSITGDIDLRVYAQLNDWSNSTQTFLAKWNGSQQSYRFRIDSSGNLQLITSTDGSTNDSGQASSAAVSFLNGQPGWVRVTRASSSGNLNYYTSPDGVNWTLLGAADRTSTAGAVFDSTSPVELGTDSLGTANRMTGKIFFAEIRNGINGTVVSRFNADDSRIISGGMFITNNVKTNYGITATINDTIGVFYNSATGTLKFYVNGVDQGTAVSGINATIYPLVSVLHPDMVIETNFGDKEFVQTVPGGASDGVYTEEQYLTRDVAYFTRGTLSHFMSGQFGEQAQINGAVRTYEGGIISGYVNSISQLRPNTLDEKAWFRSIFVRNSDTYRNQRSIINFVRNNSVSSDAGVGVAQYIPPVASQKMVFLYATTQEDLQDKFATVGATVPSLDTWTFTLFASSITRGFGINTQGIDEGGFFSTYYDALVSSYTTMFFRGTTYTYLGTYMPKVGYQTYAPDVTDLRDGDYLQFIRIYENIVGVYWVTSNSGLHNTCFRVAESLDPYSAESTNAQIRRGLSYYSSYYTIRGGGGEFTYAVGMGINEVAMNEGGTEATNPITITYADESNPTPVTVDRTGTVLKFRRDFK